MKYKVTLKGKTYEVEVDQGEAMILDEYEAYAPAPAAAPAAAAPGRRAGELSHARHHREDEREGRPGREER